MKRLIHLAFGTAFGFVLSGSGAADYGAMSRMFAFAEFQLFGVGLVTMLGSAVGLAWLARRGWRFPSRPLRRGTAWGAVLFGIGWAISGSCPGTALVQVGQGHLATVATVLGIFLGGSLHQRVNEKVLRWPETSC